MEVTGSVVSVRDLGTATDGETSQVQTCDRGLQVMTSEVPHTVCRQQMS